MEHASGAQRLFGKSHATIRSPNVEVGRTNPSQSKLDVIGAGSEQSTMTPAYTWIFTASAVFHTAIFLVTLVVVWIGWLRQRRIGFLVLAAWGLVALFNVVAPSLLGLAFAWYQNLFPNVPQYLL